MLRRLIVLLLTVPLLTTGFAAPASGQTPTPPHADLSSPGRQSASTPATPPLLISALYYDTYITGEPDEAFQIYNPLAVTVSLAGWKVTAGTRTVTFPAGITLNANARLWCARKASRLSADVRRVARMRVRRRQRSGRAGSDRHRAHVHQHGRAGHAEQPERQLCRRAGLRSRRYQRARLAGPGGLSLQTLHQLRRGRPDPLPQARPAHRAARARHRHARRLGAGPG